MEYDVVFENYHGDGAVHSKNVRDTDKHFIIDGNTRTVTNASETTNLLIQHDHNSERFTFELPRYIDGHDMSSCNVVQVHYINIDSVTQQRYYGVYEIDDMQIDPQNNDVVTCSWLISANATRYVGNLSFVLRFACVADDGMIEYAWNTAKHTNVNVTEGIYNGVAVASEYADILEQWKQELIAAGVDALTLDKTLLVEGEAADARATGEAIRVISDEFMGKEIVYSKNIALQSTATTTHDGYFNTACGCLGAVKAGKTYTLSADAYKPAPTGSNIFFRNYPTNPASGNYTEVWQLIYKDSESDLKVGETARIWETFTPTADGYLFLTANFSSNGDIYKSCTLFTNIQLEEGNEPTEYIANGDVKVVYTGSLSDWKKGIEAEIASINVQTSGINSHVQSIAHQGASGFGYPQNTVENIIACAKHGWKNAEFDVRWTSDGIPVISHDDERTVYGSTEKVTISTSTYATISSKRFFEDASIKMPTFYEVIDACRLYGLTPVIELKVAPTTAQLDNLITYLRRKKLLHESMWVSFQTGTLVMIREKIPTATVHQALSFAIDTATIDADARFATLAQGDGEAVLSITNSALAGVSDLDTYLNSLRDRGFAIATWTLDTTELISNYAPYVDYITSNVYRVEDVLVK